MSGAVYSGDDIGAVVLDIGSNTIRVGYAGEEYPRHDIPTHFSAYDNNDTKHYNFGTIGLHSRTNGAEVETFLKDGMIEDWNMFEHVINYIFNTRLNTNIENHPILITEPANKREQLVEFMFEKYNIPAIHLAKNVMLVGVSNAKSTCLVLDSGATHTTAVPVHEGYIVGQGIVKSPNGSDYVLEQTKRMLHDKRIDIVPYYKVANKEVVKADEPAIWKEKKFKATLSWHSYMVKEVLQDFHASVLQVSETQFDEDIVRTIPSVHYEFPNGFHCDFGVERFKVAEPLFNLTARSGVGGDAVPHPTTDLSTLITTSVGLCDIDTRPQLYSNIIVTGGNSNIQGFSERLSKDLQSKVPPSMRLKVIPQNGSIDRRFAPWLGGAILASLSNFQSYWISRQEYDEIGKLIVNTRC